MSHTPCSCRIEIPDLPEGRAYVLDTKYVKPDLFQIVYCPLHAAAPELLEALKDIRDNSSRNTAVGHIFTQDQLARVEAAIAHAEQQP